MKLNKYTLEELQNAIQTSVSKRQVLQKLNIAAAGGNYTTLDRAISHFNINTSHFTGQNLTGRKLPSRRKEIGEYLTETSQIQSHKLKKYLIQAKIFEHICSECKLTRWNNLPIPLELDHISGDNQDNRIENLRLLCPNCHAQTPTYRGKNKKKN